MIKYQYMFNNILNINHNFNISNITDLHISHIINLKIKPCFKKLYILFQTEHILEIVYYIFFEVPLKSPSTSMVTLIEELEESLVTAAVLLSKADSSASLVMELLNQASS